MSVVLSGHVLCTCGGSYSRGDASTAASSAAWYVQPNAPDLSLQTHAEKTQAKVCSEKVEYCLLTKLFVDRQ